jgi:hypothetical protein
MYALLELADDEVELIVEGDIPVLLDVCALIELAEDVDVCLLELMVENDALMMLDVYALLELADEADVCMLDADACTWPRTNPD